MRIVFMGTPDFAVPCLEKLVAMDEVEVAAVLTQADKPKGRGHKFMPPPVKECALRYDLPVYQPDTFRNNNEIYDILCEIAPDFIVVVAYGKLLPECILNIPKKACINIHASLLPKYRGAGPIQWAIIQGEKTTGVTSMLMAKGLDTGDMLCKEETEIIPYETAEHLSDRLSIIGAAVLEKTLREFDKIIPQKQEDALSCYAPMLNKQMAEIDFSKTSQEICHFISGLNSWPVAYTYYKEEIVKIYEAKIGEVLVDKTIPCGQILSYVKKKGLQIKTKDGSVYLRVVQFKNAKKMDIDAYLLGHSIEIGDQLGGK